MDEICSGRGLPDGRLWSLRMAFFTTSTSCYVALIVCLLFYVLVSPKGRLPGSVFLLLTVVAIIALSLFFPDTFRGIFADKISGSNESGHMREEANLNTQELLG